MISFIPRVGKVQTGQTSGGFTVIIQKKKKNVNPYDFIPQLEKDLVGPPTP